MSVLITPKGKYKNMEWETEKEFEGHIVKQANAIFGNQCIYIDCKRKIGARVGKNSIPDAYLLDFNSKQKPKLFVVEVEIASHDLFDHIGVQILQFAHSFTSSPRKVKQVLFDEISKEAEMYKRCEDYAREYGLRNLDNMLDQLVNDTFNSLVIIDDAGDELHMVLKHINPLPEVLEITTFIGSEGDYIYSFIPPFDDILESRGSADGAWQRTMDISEIDTIVVPARDEGFQETFIREDRWYEVRIHASMIPQIKYLAVYRVAPISAITHWALIKNIEPWKNTGRFVLNFAEPGEEITPIPLVQKSKVKALLGPRYTSFQKMKAATNLDEVF